MSLLYIFSACWCIVSLSLVENTEFDSTIVNSNVASRRGLLYAVSDPITAVNPIISAAGHYMAPGEPEQT
jgi:hypothetical protein